MVNPPALGKLRSSRPSMPLYGIQQSYTPSTAATSALAPLAWRAGACRGEARVPACGPGCHGDDEVRAVEVGFVVELYPGARCRARGKFIQKSGPGRGAAGGERGVGTGDPGSRMGRGRGGPGAGGLAAPCQAGGRAEGGGGRASAAMIIAT